MGKSNVCKVCGKPCKVKYCEDCREEANKIKRKEWNNGKRKPKYKGCNEDCEHCPYPDCLKPVAEMKATRETVDISEKRDIDIKSQGKMYTLNLGKYNATMPNVRRKGWY